MVNPKWWDPGEKALQRRRYGVQIDLMVNSFGGRVGQYPDTNDPADTEFLYSNQYILMKKDADALKKVLKELNVRTGAVTEPATGVTRIELLSSMTAENAIQVVQTKVPEATVYFDRVVHLASSSACPATEPEGTSLSGPLPPLTQTKGISPRPVHVAVIDTGIPAEGASGNPMGLQGWPWMANVSGGAEDTRHAGHYTGHGLFVAGVLAAMAPAVTITVYPFFFTNGGQIESDLVGLLTNAIQANPRPDVISMSAGVSIPDVDGQSPTPVEQQPLTAMAAFYQQYIAPTDTVLVCAAGNNPGSGRFEPASLDGPIGVGALDGNGPAGFSNTGAWIDVWAPGTDIVNAFKRGAYFYQEPPMPGGAQLVVNNGLVSWSGTSFATPIVAGLIANRAQTGGPGGSGMTARAAWEELKAYAGTQTAKFGGLVALDPADPNVH